MIKDFFLGSIAGSSLVLLWVYSHKNCWYKTTCPTIFICPAKVFEKAEELEEKTKENLGEVVEKSKDTVDKAKEGFKEAFEGEKEVAKNTDDNVDELTGSKKDTKMTNKGKKIKGKKIKGKKTKGKKSKTKKPSKSKKSKENKRTNDVTNDAIDKVEDFFKDETNEDFSLASLYDYEGTEDLLDSMKEHLELAIDETTQGTKNTAEDKVGEVAVKSKETLEESNHTEENENTKTIRKIKEAKKTKVNKKTSKPAWK